jgi:hypothetical protein
MESMGRLGIPRPLPCAHSSAETLQNHQHLHRATSTAASVTSLAATNPRRRARLKINSPSTALAEANRVAVNLSNQDVAAGGIDFRDAASLIQCRQLLEGLDSSLGGAVEAFAQSAKLCPGGLTGLSTTILRTGPGSDGANCSV